MVDIGEIRRGTAAETLTLVLAITTDIASKLSKIGDTAGANSLCVLIKTLEEHASTIPATVADALANDDAALSAPAQEG